MHEDTSADMGADHRHHVAISSVMSANGKCRLYYKVSLEKLVDSLSLQSTFGWSPRQGTSSRIRAGRLRTAPCGAVDITCHCIEHHTIYNGCRLQSAPTIAGAPLGSTSAGHRLGISTLGYQPCKDAYAVVEYMCRRVSCIAVEGERRKTEEAVRKRTQESLHTVAHPPGSSHCRPLQLVTGGWRARVH